jgi:hypothetical protein
MIDIPGCSERTNFKYKYSFFVLLVQTIQTQEKYPDSHRKFD